MKGYLSGSALLAGLSSLAMAAPAAAETQSPLLGLSINDLRAALSSRYDAAVAATRDINVKKASDSHFIWATEAKNQCGIAIGFAKTNRKDAESINKCDAFTARLTAPPPAAPGPAAPGPAGTNADCTTTPAVSVFFDWSADTALTEGQDTVNQVAAASTACGWKKFSVTGYTDTSGSPRYNDGLSLRRAQNVAAMMAAAGISAADITVEGRGETNLKVQTADGVREPQNRRVEINAVGGAQ